MSDPQRVSGGGTITVTVDADLYAAFLYGMFVGAPAPEPLITPELAHWEDDGGAVPMPLVHTYG